VPLLGNIASLKCGVSIGGNQPLCDPAGFDILATLGRRDLGSVADDVQKVMGKYQPHLSGGSTISFRGPVQTMKGNQARQPSPFRD
jgi:hypothetical protein